MSKANEVGQKDVFAIDPSEMLGKKSECSEQESKTTGSM